MKVADICTKINDFIQFTLRAAETTAYETIAHMLYAINKEMLAQPEEVYEKSEAVRFLACEFKRLWCTW